MKKNNSKQTKRFKKKHASKKMKLKKTSFVVKKRWTIRKKTFSPYPYIITISCFKKNVFFTVSDMYGKTRTWTSAGRAGFKNKDKTTYMAITRVTHLFFRKAWSWGVRRVILNFRNMYKPGDRVAIMHSIRKLKPDIVFKYLGVVAHFKVGFNGCRKKKQRRK